MTPPLRSLLLTFVALLSATGFYLLLSHFRQQAISSLPITAIAQTGPLKEGLKTDFFEELLDLSVDQPKVVTIQEVEKRLLATPCIKTASASFLNPKTLSIDYTLRVPRFILGERENSAMDLEGVTFPLHPFYTPKRLPLLYLGGEEERQRKLELATHLLALLGELVTMIDVSKATEPLLGQREIVLSVGPHLLRLAVTGYEEGLRHYAQLLERLGRHKRGKTAIVIDLRIPNIAYLTCGPSTKEVRNQLKKGEGMTLYSP